MIAKRAEYASIIPAMLRPRLILLIVLLSLVTSLAIMLPGWFKNPRELVQGEWQEWHKRGTVVVTDCTARWQSGRHKMTFQYAWVQDNSEPYTIEVSRHDQKWRIGVTFEDDDHALVNFYIVDKLPAEARDYIRKRNRAQNRPEDEFILRFRRLNVKK